LFRSLFKRKLEAENMEFRWIDDQTAAVSDQPDVTVSFAETEDRTLLDIILGMLLQSFSK
jgi:hypothetical protein